MCGRYNFTADPEELADWFELQELVAVPPRYNIAPSQLVAVVGPKPKIGANGLVPMRWGFVPRWANDLNDGPKPINAKSETIATNPAFRDSFRLRRCLIPATGFYEWEKVGRAKFPHHITGSEKLLGFAGIWDAWKSPTDGSLLFTAAIITTTANDRTRFLHERMPVILPREDYAKWLDNETPLDELQSMCQPYPSDRTNIVRVGNRLNKATNEGPECLEPPHDLFGNPD
jgi:putative SOS response-associated peptidase YedK